jgi:hypothetical protein
MNQHNVPFGAGPNVSRPPGVPSEITVKTSRPSVKPRNRCSARGLIAAHRRTSMPLQWRNPQIAALMRIDLIRIAGDHKQVEVVFTVDGVPPFIVRTPEPGIGVVLGMLRNAMGAFARAGVRVKAVLVDRAVAFHTYAFIGQCRYLGLSIFYRPGPWNSRKCDSSQRLSTRHTTAGWRQ